MEGGPGKNNSAVKHQVQQMLGNQRLIQFIQIWCMSWALALMALGILSVLFNDNNSAGGIFSLMLNIYSIIFSFILITTELSMARANNSLYGTRVV